MSFSKQLERGRFVSPQAKSGTVSLTRAQLSMLLEGIDWRQPARTWKPEMAVLITREQKYLKMFDSVSTNVDKPMA